MRKKQKVSAKYLAGAKNPSAKRAEILSTREKYKRGEYIDIAAVSKSRAQQAKKKSTSKKKKPTQRRR